ncbi:MAG: acyltransferase [Pseudomonadota bacterium]
MTDAAAASRPQGQQGYIPSLDGLRAISIIIVFLAHAGVSRFIPGGFGVTVFFFLSGYLITTLLCREIDRFGRVDFRGFYLRRALRILPPLTVVIAGSLILRELNVVNGDTTPAVVASQLLFFYNYMLLYGDGETIHGLFILWSLSVEEHYYFVFPFCVAFLRRSRHGVAVALGFCFLILGWRALRYFVFGTPLIEIYYATDTRIDSIVYGSVLALMEARGRWRVLPEGMWRWAVLGVAGALLLASFLVRDEEFRATLRFTFQGLGLIPVFHYAVARPREFPFLLLNNAAMRLLGRYSYTLYLVHFVVLLSLQFNGWGRESHLLYVLMGAVISIAIAAAIFELVERPCARLRRRLEHKE